jgi:hypothetical protein
VFTNELLDVIGLSVGPDSGALAEFLKELSTAGYMEMKAIDPETKQQVIFRSHEQLDCYVRDKVNYLSDLAVDFQKSYPDQWKLLKGFDRAFW